MQITAHQNFWLTEAARAVTLDFENPERFANQVSMMETNVDYSTIGWVKLGSCTTTFTMEISYDELCGKAVASMQDKLAKMEKEHQQKVEVIKEGIAKLAAIGYTAPKVVVGEQAVKYSNDADDVFPF